MVRGVVTASPSSSTSPIVFPASFVFGAGTSAFQIEGALAEDGRGPSIWDDFVRRRKGAVPGGVADVACDHYHRVAADVALMGELGIDAYRFSVAWPRVMPSGRGAVNEKGLDFYSRLVDQLLAAGIRPFVTLYHWDLPSALAERGGWHDRATASAFGEYASAVVRKLGDRVSTFTTLNEPSVVLVQGHMTGGHAPGEKGLRSVFRAMGVIHHLLLAHAEGVDAVRTHAKGARVGITTALCQVYPASGSADDRAAAHEAQELNHGFIQAIFQGHYHRVLMRPWLGMKKVIRPGDMERIARPIDFIGINAYTRAVVRKSRASLFGYTGVLPETRRAECTAMGWEVAPDALYDLLMWVHKAYPTTRLIVTENGAAYDDVLTEAGVVDVARTRYLERHVAAVGRALADGCPIDGYYVWSLVDNLEWTHGYEKRFGLVYVDFPSQRRIIKHSGHWYQRLCRERRL
jgi:beta-glucosidase